MFLNKTYEQNKKLIETSIDLHQKGLILPDSYVIDIDTLITNAKTILKKAKSKNVRLYFMLKQLGRNPYVAKKLIDLGYDGAVVVDFKEAMVMMNNNIPIGNIGNLVQIPNSMLDKVINYGVEHITVFSYSKLKLINDIAKKKNKKQKVIIRVYSDNDKLYPSQEAGININEFKAFLSKCKCLSNIDICGVTSFPAYLYNKELREVEQLNNYNTIHKAVTILKDMGFEVSHINTPSMTCSYVIDNFFKGDNLVGEPGHGLTGSTPMHADFDLVEKPCVVYVSEISHNFRDNSYVYGGGYYRRSHVENAIVSDGSNILFDKVLPMDCESIDYYFKLASPHNIGDSVVMAFRYQIFVTRSSVVLLENTDKDARIIGIYDSQGRRINE